MDQLMEWKDSVAAYSMALLPKYILEEPTWLSSVSMTPSSMYYVVYI